MSSLPELQSPSNRQITAQIIFWFLTTFALARLTVYLILDGVLPDMFLFVRGVHIHHFTYGVILLAIAGIVLLLKRPAPESTVFKLLTVTYGIGLGLTFDEFGMWIRLQDNYWIRQSYDAVIIVTLLLLNIIYYRWVVIALQELWKLLTLPIRHWR